MINHLNLDFRKFFPFWDTQQYVPFFNIKLLLMCLRGIMCFIERKTRNFIPIFREILPWREAVLRAHRMKSNEKLFFCQICVIFKRKMVHVVIDRYVSLFLKGF